MIDRFDEVVALDALALGDELLELGLSKGQVPEGLDHLGRDVTARIVDAVKMAGSVWESPR